jgi:hypothetical protein
MISGLRRAGLRVGPVLVFAVLPLVLTVSVLAVTYGQRSFLYDFHGGLFGAGRDILHGHNPYRPGYLALQAAIKRAGGAAQTVIDVPVYPAPALLAAVPFSLLPFWLAGLLFTLVSVGALVLALRLLDVTDWRCYGVALGSWPVLLGLRLGGLTPLIMLGAAIAWRCRSKVLVPAVALATIVAAKLFPWTLGGWLLVTRRWRALCVAILVGVVELVVAWAAIGFHGMTDYLHMLGNLSFVSQGAGVSPVAGLLALGLPATAAKAVALGATAALFGVALRLAKRPGGDRRAFGLAVAAALVASPMVWAHYLAFVFVPIALMSPTLSVLWFVPLLAYLAPVAQTHGKLLEILPYLAIDAIVIGHLCDAGAVARKALATVTWRTSQPTAT